MNKDEAIQVIRSNYPTGRNQLCEALETLIPELKKSDDEKIRKTLKSFFDSEISDYGNVEWRNGIRYGEIVAWLEKQGEQKPTWSEEDEIELCTIINFLKNPSTAKSCPKLRSNAIDWLKSIKDRVQPKQEWSEQEQPDVNLEKEIDKIWDPRSMNHEVLVHIARHFYELGQLNAGKEK